MKIKPKYIDQYNKITRAYLNNELEPYKCQACFVGNLLQSEEWEFIRRMNNKGFGSLGKHECTSDFEYAKSIELIESNGYTKRDIFDIEVNFLQTIHKYTDGRKVDAVYSIPNSYKTHPNYEEALFKAMESTLELLRKIHEDSGEIVDKPILAKRVLQTT